MPRVLVVIAVALAAFVSGCGGPEIAYTEVTSDPATLPIPDGTIPTSDTAEDADAGGSSKVTKSKSTTGTDPAVTDTTVAPAVPTAAPTTAPVAPDVAPVVPEDTTDDDTGAAAPPTTEEPETPADTGGAAAPTDQFCADNPGACNN